MVARKRSGPGSTKPVPARRAPTPRGVGGEKVKSPARRAGGAEFAGAPLTFDRLEYARGLIRDVPDFPNPGILFRDITPLLSDPRGFHITLDSIAECFVAARVDAIVAVESRGFIFGGALAERLNASFVPVRKPGKLPGKTDSVAYALEYGTSELHMHRGALAKNAKAVVVDDLLATGGTAAAAGELVRRQGAQVLAYAFVIELSGLGGRRRLMPSPVISLIAYK